MPEFVDAGPSQVGTALSSATLDALVVAQTYLVTGTAPAPSATLAQAFPSIGVVFNTGATATYTTIAAATLSLPGNSDCYVDAQPNGSYAAPLAVGHGAAAPSVAAGNLRAFRIVTSAGGVSSVTLIAPTQPLNATQVQNAVQLNPAAAQAGSIAVTGTVAAESDVTAGGGASLVAAYGTANNAQSSAGTANNAAGNAQSSANAAQTSANNAQSVANAAIPSTQRGAANGIPTLDAFTRVVQSPPVGFYRNVAYQQNTQHMYFGSNTSPGTTGWVALYTVNNTDFPVVTRATRGGTLRFTLQGSFSPTFGTTGSQEHCAWRINYDGGTGYVYLGESSSQTNFRTDTSLSRYMTALTAGNHSFSLEFNINGSTQQWQCLTDTNPQSDQLVLTIDDF